MVIQVVVRDDKHDKNENTSQLCAFPCMPAPTACKLRVSRRGQGAPCTGVPRSQDSTPSRTVPRAIHWSCLLATKRGSERGRKTEHLFEGGTVAMNDLHLAGSYSLKTASVGVQYVAAVLGNTKVSLPWRQCAIRLDTQRPTVDTQRPTPDWTRSARQ